MSLFGCKEVALLVTFVLFNNGPHHFKAFTVIEYLLTTKSLHFAFKSAVSPHQPALVNIQSGHGHYSYQTWLRAHLVWARIQLTPYYFSRYAGVALLICLLGVQYVFCVSSCGCCWCQQCKSSFHLSRLQRLFFFLLR